MRRLVSSLLIALVVTPACHGVDRLFEGPVPPDARLALSLQSVSMTVVQGGEQTLTASINRIGDFSGDVTLAIEDVPSGVTATVGAASTTGSLTTSTLTVRVTAGAPLGQYVLTVRARANQLPDATARLTLVVSEAPAFSMTLSRSALSIIRGGLAPLAVSLTRTNLSAPITVSAGGVTGVSANFTPNPIGGDVADGTISVGSGVAPGTYTVSFRAVAPGGVERSADLTLTVLPDATQLIASPDISAAQGASVDTRIIINRGSYTGDIALSAESLPAGVTAAFQPEATTPASSATLALSVAPSVDAGSYRIVVRAKAAGLPDATAELRLTVSAVSLSVAIEPATVSVFQGGAGTQSTLTITRTGFTGPVSISIEGAPPGVTVMPDSPHASGTTIGLTTTASASAVPEVYPVIIRATPAGFPASASRTVTLSVNVRAAPTGSGNVILDWSGCKVPSWIAAQDGSGPWMQVLPVAGVARFNVTSTKGAFAYVEAGQTVVSYMTHAELTGRPMVMCPPPAPTKVVTGISAPTTTLSGEQATYYLGGGIGTSTAAAPNFTINGVADGVHDLVGWASGTVSGIRGYIERDIDVANGGSLGTVPWSGPGSFAPQRASLTFSGFFTGDVSGTFAMAYATTAACTVNPLFSGVVGQMLGVPEFLQRASDFHLLTITAASAANARTRTATIAFHTLSDRSVAFPPAINTPAVAAAPGGYKRLQVTAGDLPAVYNGAFTFEYSDGAKSMRVTASIAYTGTTGVAVVFPDFSGVSGWQNAFAIGDMSSGSWTVTINGGTSTGSLCAEGERRISITFRGAF